MMEKISIFTKVRINSSRENLQTCVMSVRTLNFLVVLQNYMLSKIKTQKSTLLEEKSTQLLILIYIRAYIHINRVKNVYSILTC